MLLEIAHRTGGDGNFDDMAMSNIQTGCLLSAIGLWIVWHLVVGMLAKFPWVNVSVTQLR